MSKLGKKPIPVPAGVEAKIEDHTLTLKGKEGTMTLPLLPHLKIELGQGSEGAEIKLSPTSQEQQAGANWGTMTALVKNAAHGVSQGFTKVLEIEGIGFKAAMEGANISLTLGFTHPVKVAPPAGIKIAVEKNIIKISGADKALVGEVAANIRKLKKPEPYKGKGIRYQGETIRRKAGKKVAGTGTGA